MSSEEVGNLGGYAVAAVWPTGLLRAQTTVAAPLRTRVWSEPQMHRVHTVVPVEPR